MKIWKILFGLSNKFSKKQNRYLYTGHVNLADKSGMETLTIIIASDDLKLNQLTKVTEDFFVENHHQSLRDDPVGILQTVYCHQALKNLQKYCWTRKFI